MAGIKAPKVKTPAQMKAEMAVSRARGVMPKAERDANLGKMLDESAIKDRLYHGTTSDITKFDPDKARSKTGNINALLGTFMSDNPAEASRFASEWGTTGGNVMPVYASLKNPYNASYKEMDDLAMGVYRRMMQDPSYDPNRSYRGFDKEGQKRTFEMLEKHEPQAIQDAIDFKNKLIEAGHDGIIWNLNGNKEVIAFEPTQIKSAIGNRGTYDTSDPDITKAEGGEVKTPPVFEQAQVPFEEIRRQFGMNHGGAVHMAGGGMKPKLPQVTLPAAQRSANLERFMEGSVVPPVYHATNQDFSKFSLSKAGANTKHPTSKLGIFTAANPQSTDEFITSNSGVTKGMYYQGANVMPLHLSIKNPFEISSSDFVFQSMALQSMKKKDASKYVQDFIDSVKAEGHDGLLIKSNPRGFAGGNEFSSDNYVAFEPTQIKSAIGNQGTYDPADPDITKAKGGAVHMAGGGKPPKVSAPSVMKRSGISELAEYIKNREGSYGERRVQRAADEIPRLGELYTQDALRSAFSGSGNALMTVKPSEFENYAAPLFTNLSKESKDNIANLKAIQSVGGFSDVPFFLINKELAGSTGLPWVTGHEGRHRNRAMDAAGEQAGLVRFEPRAELREPFPRRSQEQYIDAIRKEMALSGNKIKPEKYYLQETDEKTFQRPTIDLPDLYAKGGAVKMAEGGDPQAEIDRMRLELSRKIKPTTDVNEQIANAQRMASPERLSLDAGDAITSPEMYEQNRDLFTVNRKPASQAYTEFGVPMIDAAGKSVPFPKTMHDIEIDKVEKQLEAGIKPSWMSGKDFIEDQAARKGYVTSPKTAGDFGQNAMAALMGSKFLGGTLRALGAADEAAQAVIGSSYGLDPTMGIIGQTGRLHRVPRGLSTIKEGIARDVGQFPNDFFNAQRGITQGYPTLGSVTGDVVGKVAPIVSKIDDAVRLGYESGRIPQIGMSIKDVTPKVLAPANPQGFYSATEAAALNLPRKSGSGQAFLNDLLKQENVRPDEINAMGLDEWLKGKKDVTAAEVQDYIANNKIQLGESTYKDMPKITPEQKTRLSALERGNFERLSPEEFEQSSGAGSYKELLRLQNARDRFGVDQLRSDASRSMKEARRYQAFNNQNGPVLAQKYIDKARILNDRADLLEAEMTSAPPKFKQWSLPGGENYREVVITLPSNRPSLKNMSRSEYNAAVDAADKTGVTDYKSTHWDDPNPIAHLRMSDRVTDGKKTLLVDEVQSDWHQAGREKGYRKNDPLKKNPDGTYTLTNPDGTVLNLPSTVNAQILREGLNAGLGVPDAPFKDDWYQLALKRAVKEAIDGGYDRVALPTGSRVSERFDLSKQIDRIDYNKNDDGTYSMSAIKDGREVFAKEGLDEKELSGIVGKDVAKKIVGDEGSSAPKADRWEAEDGDVPEFKSLSGLDLSVGGEGMRKYYDEIYPGYLKKFGKKYGAKVGQTEVNTPHDLHKYTIEEMDELFKSKGRTGESYEDFMYRLRDQGTPEPLHYMEITPAMREAFKTGIHMKRGGKVQFANNIDAMRLALSKG